jgi:hypothetical protein
VGLLLGSLIADQGMLTKQQEKLMASIRTDIDNINSQNLLLQTQLKQLEEFQNQVFPFSIKNRLDGKKVGIVRLTDGQGQLVGEIDKALAQAGAETFVVEIKVKGLDFSDKDLVGQLRAAFESTETIEGDFERAFWLRLGSELLGEEPSLLLERLLEKGLIDLDLGELPVENLVVPAADRTETGGRDAFFLDGLSQVGRGRIIGVETQDTKPSRMAAYKLRHVSTVDNIDTVPGKISLVYLLEEQEITAHLGTKSTAERLMP